MCKNVKDVSRELDDGVGQTDVHKSLKRRHSGREDSGKMPSDENDFDQCTACMEGIINNKRVVHITDTTGNQTILGMCGTVARGATSYDIILLFLDQLIMHLLHIHDIRLLWSTDTFMWEEFKRTHPQTEIHLDGLLIGVPFQARSRYPPLYIRDVSFWCPTEGEFDELRFMSVLRQASGLLSKRVSLRDVYRDKERGDLSRCYRIEYLSCDQALSKEKLAKIHHQVLELLKQEMGLLAR